MKKITIIIFSLLIVSSAFTQSKKDLDQKILLLEEKTKNFENEILNIKTNLTNSTTTLSLVSKSNLDLEKQVKEQSLIIEKLIKQNDSLLIIFKIKKDIDFVTTPINEEDSIIFLIQSYFACKKWEDRLAYVLKPETVKSFMNDYYTDNYTSATYKKNDVFLQGSGYKLNDIFKVKIEKRNIYCKKTSDGYKIDWEATIGYNQKSFPDFLSEISKTPNSFRMSIELSDNYREDYNITSNEYYSFSGGSENGGWENFIMKKNTPGANDLKKLVADGKSHQVIIEIVFKNIQHKDYDIPKDFILISKFINGGWSKE